MNTEIIKTYVEMYLINLLFYKRLTDSSIENNQGQDNPIFKGFCISDEEIYIFYDITMLNIEQSDMYINAPLWFALIDEIVNDNHICNINISKEVEIFFINNIDFCFLKDERNVSYSSPIVAYIGENDRLLNFRYMFGVSPREKNAILGKYFYFTDYINAIKQGAWNETGNPEYKHGKLITKANSGKYIKGGIIRIALFMERIKIIQNLQSDEIDKSDIKRERMEDPTLDKHYEYMTLRISDYDGNWVNEYDGVFVGPVELDDGTILKNTPIYVVKDYNQQLPLTYHYINMSKLADKRDDNNEYLII
jgi:hypothetical protein